MLPFLLQQRYAAAWDFWTSKADREVKDFRITEGGHQYTADEYIKMKRWKLKQFANLENVLIAVSVGSFVLAMILGLL